MTPEQKTAAQPLSSSDVITFIGTSNAEKAKVFYRDVLGLKFVKEELPFALVFDLNGVMLRIAIGKQFTPLQMTVLGWIVPDIRASIVELRGRGVQFKRYDGMNQDDFDVWHAPGGAQIAWFNDPDGNTLSLTQFTARG